MSHVNYWLLALAFGLGLLITLAFMIRKVKREVPVYGALGGGSGSAEASTAKPAAAAAAVAGGGVAAAKLVGSGSADEEPYGAGSFRLASGSSVPSGWEIKGNEDSMLYHTTDSPSYEQTIAEIWFRDEPTAVKAGFTRWDKGGSAAGIATLAATEQEIPPGPHGPGSTTPAADGSGPAGWTVKGNEESMLYHSTESPSYAVTRAEVWFRDVETAEAAGFNRWDSGKSQRGIK